MTANMPTTRMFTPKSMNDRVASPGLLCCVANIVAPHTATACTASVYTTTPKPCSHRRAGETRPLRYTGRVIACPPMRLPSTTMTSQPITSWGMGSAALVRRCARRLSSGARIVAGSSQGAAPIRCDDGLLPGATPGALSRYERTLSACIRVLVGGRGLTRRIGMAQRRVAVHTADCVWTIRRATARARRPHHHRGALHPAREPAERGRELVAELRGALLPVCRRKLQRLDHDAIGFFTYAWVEPANGVELHAVPARARLRQQPPGRLAP